MDVKILISLVLVFVAKEASSQQTYRQGNCIYAQNYTITCGSADSLKSLLDSFSSLPDRIRFDGRIYYDTYDHTKFVKLTIRNSNISSISSYLFMKFRNLQDFDASNVGIIKIQREDLLYSDNLIRINLSGNKISALGNFLFQHCSSLREIDLSRNQISDIETNAFDGVSKLFHRIDMSFNKLVSIQMEVIMPIKQQNTNITIDLSVNQIEFIAESKNASQVVLNVTSLNLSKNKLKSFELSQYKIEKLMLQDNQIASLKLNGPIKEIFIENNNLRELHVKNGTVFVSARNNKIADFTCEKGANLKWLLLTGNQVGNKALDEIQHCTNMWQLDLAQTSLQPLKINAFAQFESLEHLNLAINMIKNVDFGMFAHNPLLKTLNLSTNSVRELNLHALSSLENLEILDLSGNALTELRNGEELTDILPKLKQLGAQNNKWSCEYLSKLKINLNTKNITILAKATVLKNETSVSGIRCFNSSETDSENEIEPSQNGQYEHDVMRNLQNQMDNLEKRLRDFEGDKQFLFSKHQKDILAVQKVLIRGEQRNNGTFDEHQQAIDQLIRKINQQTADITSNRMELKKLQSGFEPTESYQPDHQALATEKLSGFSQTEMFFAIMLSVMVTTLIIIGFLKSKKFLIDSIMQIPLFTRSRQNSFSTVVTFDNSSAKIPE